MNLLTAISFLALCSLGLCRSNFEQPSSISGEDPNGFLGDDILVGIEQEVEDALIEVLEHNDQESKASTKEDEVVRSLENESSSQGLHSISHTVKVKKSDEKVDFNGIQVSHQQYSRLVKLQEKVLTMNKMIRTLHEKYSQEMLDKMPQYRNLMQLHALIMQLMSPEHNRNKRFSVEFLGHIVSFPQYLRMKRLQNGAIKLDQFLRESMANYPPKVLLALKQWKSAVELHTSLRTILPPDYHLKYPNIYPERLRAKRINTFEFNGVQTSDPRYIRLANTKDVSKLLLNEKWLELEALERSLQSLLPASYPTFPFEINEDSSA